LQSAADATITKPVNLIVQRSSARLSAREREVLTLVAAGISNKGIARELRVSPNTVKFHIAAILEKLDAGTRAEAVVAALRRGELSL
jgi:two-component system nitrate/nitrite response regulator NarL